MNHAVYPDYYKEFACAMGQCRLNCCRENWEIPLMKSEYEAIRAAGRKNKGELAELIGKALAREGASGGAYAHIRHGRDGACPLCTVEGLCQLHAACGPQVLGSVCRTFPRSHVLWKGVHRQSCSAGCQAVVSLLKNRQAPLAFEEGDFVADGWETDKGTFLMPVQQLEKRPVLGRLEELQPQLAALLQQREKPMSRRMGELAATLYELDKAEKRGEGNAPLACKEAVSPDENVDLRNALAAVALFTTVFFQNGTPEEQAFVGQIWQNCGVRFVQGKMGTELHLDVEAYRICAQKREALWAEKAPCLWEHLMVNQLFQDRLPFGDGTGEIWDNTLYFCSIYAILRFLTAGVAGGKWEETEDALVRGIRKYTHSTLLMPRTVEQLHRRKMDTPEGLACLLSL